jgi:hypothetical protein
MLKYAVDKLREASEFCKAQNYLSALTDVMQAERTVTEIKAEITKLGDKTYGKKRRLGGRRKCPVP